MASPHVNGQPNWQELVARKHQQYDRVPAEWRLSSETLALAAKTPRLLELDVPRHSGIMSDEELDITENYSASALLKKLSAGEMSSVDATTAFCKRAAIAQQVVSRSDSVVQELVSNISDLMLDRNILPTSVEAGSISR